VHERLEVRPGEYRAPCAVGELLSTTQGATMKKIIAAAILLGLAASASAQTDAVVLEFRTMAGVSGPYVGAANPIRGIAGGGIPWILGEARGELRRDGRLEIRVRSLVLATTLVNPAPAFRGVVSCQIIDGAGAPSHVNLSTGDFPATSAGDADIEANLALPGNCFAPIIFVTNSAGRWFAVTGY
jgi:hypothetical protein